MKRGLFFLGVIFILSMSARTACCQDRPHPKLRQIQHIKDNLYWIPGGDVRDRANWTGGNIGVFVTEQGVVLVDTGFSGNGEAIREQVKTVTDKPVIMIINTHTHGDHNGSNNEFPADIQFVAHENTKTNMQGMPQFQGQNAKYLPNKTFNDKMSLFSGKDRIDLYYLGRGHTDGDTWVVFPEVRVVQSGDVFSRRAMANIDVKNHADALENYQTLSKALNTFKNMDAIITGHEPMLMSVDNLREYTDFYKQFVDYVNEGFNAGKSVDEVAASYKPAEKYKDYDIDPARVKANVAALFMDFKK